MSNRETWILDVFKEEGNSESECLDLGDKVKVEMDDEDEELNQAMERNDVINGWSENLPTLSSTSNSECDSESPSHSPTLPHCSPSTSPQLMNEDEKAISSGRGYSVSRGRSRSKRAKIRHADDSEVSKQIGWKWRLLDPVVEVCPNDEDIPPRLQEVIQSGAAQSADQMPRKRKVELENDTEQEYASYSTSTFKYENSIATELFGGDYSVMNFQWSPMASFSGSRSHFQPQEQPGPRFRSPCAYEAFRQIWDENILEHIVRETNRYAVELKTLSKKFESEWYDTNIHEIITLFAFWIMLGIVRMPSIRSCFSTSPLLKTSVFRTLMTENRYWLLNKALHFVDNSTRNKDSPQLFSLGPLIEHLNNKFQESYTPGQNLTIEASVTSWTGTSYVPDDEQAKATKFGIKMYELSDTATGYMWSFLVCLDKDRDNASKLPKSMDVVVRLVKPLLNKGYTLFLNNWLHLPILARFLKLNNTDCVGTLQKSCRDVPPLLQLASVPEGKCIARHSGDMVVMAYQNKKPMYTISTYHGTDSICINAKPGQNRPALYKPTVIADYNMHIGKVDRKDQILEPYMLERARYIHWYLKMFRKLLSISICNSYLLLDDSKNDNVNLLAFRLNLVDEIMKKHLANVPNPRKFHPSHRNSDLSQARLSGHSHYIVRADVSEQRTQGNSRTSRNRRNCVWCSVREKRRRKTVWICEVCEEPLCIEGCFKKYHTES